MNPKFDLKSTNYNLKYQCDIPQIGEILLKLLEN